jgi:predicted phosphodiesterase
MKLLIASDIHGSAEYCRQMIKAVEREDVSKVLLLGDLL